MEQAFARAVYLFQQGQLEQAEVALNELCFSGGETPDVLHLLGMIKLQTKRPAEAAEHLEKSLEAKPGSAEMLALLGTAYRRNGQLEDAASAFERAIARDPDRANVHYNFGNTLRDLGRLDDAVAYFQKAVTLEPEFTEARFNLSHVLHLTGRLEEATLCCLELVAANPDDAESHAELGKALYAQERHEDAIATFRRVLEIDPDHASALAATGMALFEQQQFEDAALFLRKAAEQDKEFNIGRICLLGDEYRARTAPERFDEIAGKMPKMTGILPKTSGTGPVVMIACDHSYFRKFGQTLALSVDRFAPGHDLHLHMMGPEPSFEDELAVLRDNLGATTLTVTTEVPQKADRLYYPAARFVRLVQIMEETGRDFLHLDADSLIRSPLRSINAIDPSADIAIPMRPKTYILRFKVLISSLYVRNRPAAMRFMHRFGAYLADRIVEGKLGWALDQAAFYVTYRMMGFDGEDVSVVDLPKTLCDNGLGPESDIWALKGGLKQEAAYERESAKLFEDTSLKSEEKG